MTGETIDLSETPSPWQGDGAYNARTGMIWQTEVAFTVFDPPQCLFEIDPVAKLVTGNRICGPWTNFPPIVGLAYDYATDTYYVGDSLGVITHVNGAGDVLDSGSTGLQISGLAYNPTTRHLFVQTFSNVPFDTYVFDPHNNYLPLSGFSVKSAGVPVLNSRGVSLEADCSGHLWAFHVDEDAVYEFESGETGWCVNEISWLAEDPTSGTVPGVGGPGGPPTRLPVTVSFDSAGTFSGPLSALSGLDDRHADAGGRRCRSTSRFSSATCRSTASPGTTSTARPEPGSCRAAPRSLRSSRSARTRS